MAELDFERIRRKKRYGRCRICQKFTKLTKEHVPPAKAFNNRAFFQHYIDESAKAERVRWQFREEDTNGIYIFTLCEKCNNRTGTIYGTEYVNFVQAFQSHAIPENANKKVNVEVENFFPLRVVKQVISMVLSTSKPTSFRNYEFVGSPSTNPSVLKKIKIEYPEKDYQLKLYDELRNFVRKKDSKGLPNSVRLYAFASIKAVGFRTGIFSSISLNKKSVAWLVATGLHPIHWILVFDGELDKELLEVTDWANYGYKERITKKIEVPCYWLAGKYPLDFRSPQELYEGHFINSMRQEGFIPSQGVTKEQELNEAVYFARILGTVTKEGYVLTKFSSGIYYEVGDINGWMRDATVEDVYKLVNWRLNQDGQNN